MQRETFCGVRSCERGVALFIVAGVLVALLAVAALAIDLGMLYVARNEAQRAADAAALAGAEVFITSGCTSAAGGCVPGGSQEAGARQQAEAVAAKNYIDGQPVVVPDSDVSFSYPTSTEPQITVTVKRVKADNNALPTFFARIFGVLSADVSVSSMAEAYAGEGSPVGTNCVAPFLVPNCDPDHYNVPARDINTTCDTAAGYFVNTSTNPPSIENPGLYVPPNGGGAQGEEWTLHTNAGPSQYYLVAFTLPSGVTPQSASNERTWIQQCTPQVIACNQTINTMDGAKVGPTDQGVDGRIHASADGMNQGQDTINVTSGPPFAITGGANNPIPSLVGQIYYGPSDSVITVPVYAGQPLPPGGTSVQVVGFMQLFVEDASHQGNKDVMDSIVLNVLPCNSASTGTGGTAVVSTGGSPIPIRLIHP